MCTNSTRSWTKMWSFSAFFHSNKFKIIDIKSSRWISGITQRKRKYGSSSTRSRKLCARLWHCHELWAYFIYRKNAAKMMYEWLFESSWYEIVQRRRKKEEKLYQTNVSSSPKYPLWEEGMLFFAVIMLKSSKSFALCACSLWANRFNRISFKKLHSH